jgi:hypothetical protein
MLEYSRFVLEKLFYIVDSGEYSHLIQWNDDGDAFQIKNQDGFMKGVLLHMFKQTKFESFHRKLNRWRFSKVRRQRYTWRHPFFQKGRLDLCIRIKEGSPWSNSLALTKSNDIKNDHVNMKQEMFRNQQDQGARGIMNQTPQQSGIMIDRSNPTNLNNHSSSILPIASGFVPYNTGTLSQQLSGNAYMPLSGLNQHICNHPVLLSNTIQNNMQYRNNNQSLLGAMNQSNFHQPILSTYMGGNQEMNSLNSTKNLETTNYVAIPVQTRIGNMPIIGSIQNATQESHNIPFEVLGRHHSDMGLTAQTVAIQGGSEEIPQGQELNRIYNTDGNYNFNHSTMTAAYPAQRDDNDHEVDSDQAEVEK